MPGSRGVLVDALGPCPGLGRASSPRCNFQPLKMSFSIPVSHQLRAWNLDGKVGCASGGEIDIRDILLHARSLSGEL